MKRLQKHAVLYLALLLVCVGLLGCGPSGNLPLPTLDPSATPLPEDFDAFCEGLFIEWNSGDSFSINYTFKNPENYGLADFEATWGAEEDEELTEEESIAKAKAENKRLRDHLESFDYNALSKEQQYVYDMLDYELMIDLESLDFPYYYEPMIPGNGFAFNALINLTNYYFERQKDLDDYLALCYNIEDYIDILIKYEQEKADAGLFMSDSTLDEVLDELKRLIEKKDDHMLIEVFNERIDNEVTFLSAEQKAEYKQKNVDAVQKGLIPAYQKLIDALEALRGKGINEGGLAGLPKGKEYAAHRIKARVNTEMTPEEMAKLLDDTLTKAQDDFFALLDNQSAINEYLDYKFNYASPEAAMQHLVKESAADFPQLPQGTKYVIKRLDDSMSDTQISAFYFTPRVDDIENNLIYYNPGHGTDGLFDTLGHEGVPGHMLHFTRHYEKTEANLGKTLDALGCVEGWAKYVDSYCLKYERTLSEAGANLIRTENRMGYCLQARLEIGVHYQGWDLAACEKYFKDTGMDQLFNMSQDFYDTVVQNQISLLPYAVGPLEVERIKEEYKQKMGDDYSELQFHTDFINCGPAPFYLVEKQLGLN
ncbi:DUF885 domain-containing protein [Eubacteriales bacterium OttesenSCG-928-N14]|nr:DUF885 domain-containing protein [Eubacteriales bacterium OttesenSCG-928-N14]